MEDTHLSLGAHLLLWGIPLALTLVVVIGAIREVLRLRRSS
jgi:hypothetical protein